MNAERLAERKTMIERSRRLNENLARLADRQGVIDTFDDLLYRTTDMFAHDMLRDFEDVAVFVTRNR